MTNDEAMKLARRLKVQLEGTDDALLCHVITLCAHILSSSMKREIENAAFKLAITAVHAIRLNPPYTATIVQDNACDAIRALIQPPAQQESVE